MTGGLRLDRRWWPRSPSGSRRLMSWCRRRERGIKAGSGLAVNIVGSGTGRALGDFRLKQLGDAGEEWVVDLEREALARDGRADLAERVAGPRERSATGAGYDVASYYPDGRRA